MVLYNCGEKAELLESFGDVESIANLFNENLPSHARIKGSNDSFSIVRFSRTTKRYKHNWVVNEKVFSDL